MTPPLSNTSTTLICGSSNLKSKLFGWPFNQFRYLSKFEDNEGGFLNFARSYKKFGLNINESGDLVYREWAPGAKQLSLVRFRPRLY